MKKSLYKAKLVTSGENPRKIYLSDHMTLYRVTFADSGNILSTLCHI